MTSPYPIEKVNLVSECRTFLQRIGATGDSVGCIQLLSTGSVVAGYVHFGDPCVRRNSRMRTRW